MLALCSQKYRRPEVDWTSRNELFWEQADESKGPRGLVVSEEKKNQIRFKDRKGNRGPSLAAGLSSSGKVLLQPHRQQELWEKEPVNPEPPGVQRRRQWSLSFPRCLHCARVWRQTPKVTVTVLTHVIGDAESSVGGCGGSSKLEGKIHAAALLSPPFRARLTMRRFVRWTVTTVEVEQHKHSHSNASSAGVSGAASWGKLQLAEAEYTRFKHLRFQSHLSAGNACFSLCLWWASERRHALLCWRGETCRLHPGGEQCWVDV